MGAAEVAGGSGRCQDVCELPIVHGIEARPHNPFDRCLYFQRRPAGPEVRESPDNPPGLFTRWLAFFPQVPHRFRAGAGA